MKMHLLPRSLCKMCKEGCKHKEKETEVVEDVKKDVPRLLSDISRQLGWLATDVKKLINQPKVEEQKDFEREALAEINITLSQANKNLTETLSKDVKESIWKQQSLAWDFRKVRDQTNFLVRVERDRQRKRKTTLLVIKSLVIVGAACGIFLLAMTGLRTLLT